MDLVIDLGNTKMKAALFQNTTLKQKFSCKKSASAKELNIILQNNNPARTILSSVSSVDDDTHNLTHQLPNYYELNDTLQLPITLKYTTPETLGNDRIAAVCGAYGLFPDENILVIDAGTCITYDFINAQNEYLGGGISPGISMRFKALNHYTDKLPLIKRKLPQHIIGDSTEQSILSGVVNGVAAELNGIIQLYRTEYQVHKVLITGGDAHFLKTEFTSSIEVIDDLVLLGLHQILIFNEN